MDLEGRFVIKRFTRYMSGCHFCSLRIYIFLREANYFREISPVRVCQVKSKDAPMLNQASHCEGV